MAFNGQEEVKCDSDPHSFIPQKKQKNRKIEEDYTMYDEVKDNDELEDIIEEDIEEESEDDTKDENMITSHEERVDRREKREEIKTLRT